MSLESEIVVDKEKEAVDIKPEVNTIHPRKSRKNFSIPNLKKKHMTSG